MKKIVKSFAALSLVGLPLLLNSSAMAQKTATRADSLRGSITPERAWWDLKHYELRVQIDPSTKSIKGSNQITYKVLNQASVLQIDLQEPLKVTSITQGGEPLTFRREGAVHWVTLTKKQEVGQVEQVLISYEGIPKEAIRPPWEGGITWQKDSKGLPFVASSNQGIGSSIWWPLKDHPADEVDSLDMHVTVPKGLMDISNGRLVEIEVGKDMDTFHWKVVNPINDYGVNINVGIMSILVRNTKGKKGR